MARMSFPPVLHEIPDSLRFGRVLFVEISPGPPAERPDRYADVLARRARPPSRAHFSPAEHVVRQVLARIDRGMPIEAVVFGGAGDPLRHRGIGTILRRLRATTHLETIVLADGVLLGDREVRREAGEAGWVVVWLPALEDRAEAPGNPERRDVWERHVEGAAALRRETPARVALELPVRPGFNDGEASLAAWRRSVERVRPERVFVVPAPGVEPDEAAEPLERTRLAVHPKAGAFLDDGTLVERRSFPEGGEPEPVRGEDQEP
jgi:hypothetical protein